MSNWTEILNKKELMTFLGKFHNNSKKWIRLRKTNKKTTLTVKHILENNLDCILVDEAQFLTAEQVDEKALEWANQFDTELAEMLSNEGIKTAILDLTKNKNSYYIYTNNEEELRGIAQNSFENLTKGISEGISINKNLSVFTSLPGNDDSLDDVTNIIQTLLENFTVVLMDCDFNTDPRYFKIAQEIYLVQTLDVLTIQPLTAFLRDLKVKGVLEPYKLRIVINKNIKINSLNDRILIGGMSVYNDPGMTYMTELFDKEIIKYTTIPFENQTYVKYLEGLVNCKISSKGYSKNFMASMKKLSDMVYPTLNGKKQKIFNDYSKKNKKYENTFSKSTSTTLDKMKKNY